MSDDFLFPLPVEPTDTLDTLRAAVVAAQHEAVAALRAAESECGESHCADELEKHWSESEECRECIQESRRIIEADITQDDDGYDHPTRDQQNMLKKLKQAEAALDKFDSAHNALRARELAEIRKAGATPSLPKEAKP